MILIIDDQKTNLILWDYIFRNDRIIFAQSLETEHLQKDWDFVYIDKNGNEDGVDVMDKLLLANPKLAGKVFIMSASDFDIPNFIHKDNFVNILKNILK
jgi:hypothetical protein